MKDLPMKDLPLPSETDAGAARPQPRLGKMMFWPRFG